MRRDDKNGVGAESRGVDDFTDRRVRALLSSANDEHLLIRNRRARFSITSRYSRSSRCTRSPVEPSTTNPITPVLLHCCKFARIAVERFAV